MPKNKLTRYDVLVMILVALLIPLSGFFLIRSDGSGSTCVITTQAEEFRYSLAEDRILTVEGDGGLHLTVTIADGGVSVISSDCPDGVCIRTGVIRKAGEAIVCVPARVVIAIHGASTEKGDEDADFIIG